MIFIILIVLTFILVGALVLSPKPKKSSSASSAKSKKQKNSRIQKSLKELSKRHREEQNKVKFKKLLLINFEGSEIDRLGKAGAKANQLGEAVQERVAASGEQELLVVKGA